MKIKSIAHVCALLLAFSGARQAFSMDWAFKQIKKDRRVQAALALGAATTVCITLYKLSKTLFTDDAKPSDTVQSESLFQNPIITTNPPSEILRFFMRGNQKPLVGAKKQTPQLNHREISSLPSADISQARMTPMPSLTLPPTSHENDDQQNNQEVHHATPQNPTHIDSYSNAAWITST